MKLISLEKIFSSNKLFAKVLYLPEDFFTDNVRKILTKGIKQSKLNLLRL